MENELVREDSESTQRKAWSAAEAAAFPALGIHPAQTPEALSRVPRSSVAPPSSETVVTPAPEFNGEGAGAAPIASPAKDDLDGIVELSSSMLEDDGDTGLHKIEMLAEDLVMEVRDDDVVELPDLVPVLPELPDVLPDVLPELPDVIEIPASEVIEEVDSGLLAYVEARGEISEKHHAVPAASDVSKVSLASLHESLHTQAVASGMLSYSTGVPVHDLESGISASKTLQIHRPSSDRSKLIKNLLIGGVFFCGIAAGVYFGLPSESTPAASVAGEVPAQVAASTEAIVAPEPATEAEPQIPVTPTVAPLSVAPLAVDVDTDSVAAAVADSETEVASATEVAPAEEPTVAPLVDHEIQVRPLGDVEDSETVEEAMPEMVVHAVKKKDLDTEVAKPIERKVSRKARSKEPNDLKPGTLGTGAAADPGVLMLAAKPPCDILIDGKKTGLKTPQRVLRLPPGKHKVTLVNREHKLRDSFRVSIQSGKKTKVVRDMTSKIK